MQLRKCSESLFSYVSNFLSEFLFACAQACVLFFSPGRRADFGAKPKEKSFGYFFNLKHILSVLCNLLNKLLENIAVQYHN